MESPSRHTMIEFTVDLLKMRQSLKCEGEQKSKLLLFYYSPILFLRTVDVD